MRALVIALGALFLAACSGPNTSLQTVQVSGTTDAFPTRYREVAAGIAVRRQADTLGSLAVSRPQTLVGTSAFDPLRWYVCIRGLAPLRLPRPTPVPIWELAQDLARPSAVSGTHDVVVVFDGNAAPATFDAFDAKLCRHAHFEPLPLPVRGLAG